MRPMIDRKDITGLVLAGGRGSRMGGVDKGLQPHLGRPLALHALERLRPQVGPLMVNANRHLETYAAFGVPVHADPLPEFPGPLSGLLAGLVHAATPWLVTVPCDTPDFPEDLVAKLAARADGHDIVMAASVEDGALRTQPVFALVRRALAADLRATLEGGERKVDRWTARHRTAVVAFDDAAAFFNANTPQELARLQPPAPPAPHRT